ncbi:hypothetical protein SCUP515_02324 [Seiridium cupressi]
MAAGCDEAEKSTQPVVATECGEGDRFTVFTRKERWCIVTVVSYASWCSNLSSFIFLPSLKLLSDNFSVSISQANLTVTVYMAVATIAPTLVGDTADVLGRRPAYFLTLGLFFVANVCLALATTWGQFLGFRVLQGLGQSGIILIGYGVVSDIASPAERGTFMSAVSFAVTVGPCVGPILGGFLSYAAGWNWVFWFLAIVTGPCLVFVILLLPETSRDVVSNGSLKPPTYSRLPFTTVMCHWPKNVEGPPREGGRIPNPLGCLKVLLRRDNAVVVLAWGFMYAVYSCNISTLATLFQVIYDLTEWEAGLMYLPFAVGGIVSTIFSGRLLDSAYRRARTKQGLSTDRVRGDNLDDFPIERVRLSVMWAPMVVIGLFMAGYGWALQYRQHIATTVVLQFFAGLALQVNFSAFNTLLVDINHKNPAAANASTSVIRCAFAAIAVAYIEDLIQAIGVGWAFTFLGSLSIVVLGLFALEYKNGMMWRQAALHGSIVTQRIG